MMFMNRYLPAGSAGLGVAGKKNTERLPELGPLLSAFIERHKAGSPTEAGVYWVSLKPWQLAARFFQEHQLKVSHGLVKRHLRQLGYGYRKQAKQLATGSCPHRDEQFGVLCSLVLVMSLQSPVLSIDCKKKERLGNLYRAGKCYCTRALQVYDHDYEHLSQGRLIPHGIYDLQANQGYISVGSSCETAAFIVDNLLWWWLEHGIHRYPDASNILLLCDAGGGNSYRHHAFKLSLQELARQTGLSVVVCHYPPYCSKYNPIEHRLFCHVHRAMEGAVLKDYQTVKQLIEQTSTKTGLTVVVRLNLKHYQKGIKTDKNQIDKSRIAYHPAIPDFNYRIYP